MSQYHLFKNPYFSVLICSTPFFYISDPYIWMGSCVHWGRSILVIMHSLPSIYNILIYCRACTPLIFKIILSILDILFIYIRFQIYMSIFMTKKSFLEFSGELHWIYKLIKGLLSFMLFCLPFWDYNIHSI